MLIEKKIKKNYNLADLNTFRISGRAEYLAEVRNKRELIQALEWSKSKKIPSSIIAGGSNILIIKPLIKGLVLRITGQQYKINGNTITSWAGTSLTALAKAAANKNLSGLEWAMGVPGTVGGAARGNAGAFGGDISKQAREIEVYDRAKRRLVKLNNQSCGFKYRHSIFKNNQNLIIVNVKLKLVKGEKNKIVDSSSRNLRLRRLSHPNKPSAGCVFKNLEYKKLLKQNRALAADLMGKGLIKGGKMGVAYLIDKIGLKGLKKGGAKISEKHANFIINTNKAKASDVLDLIKLIKKKIKLKYKINLEEEIQFLG